MSNTEIIALVATCIGVISFALVITILYKNYIGKMLSETEDGLRDIELIDTMIYEGEKRVQRREKALSITKSAFYYVFLVLAIPFLGFAIYSRITNGVVMIGDSSAMVVASGSMSEKNPSNDYLVTYGLDNQFKTYDLITLKKVDNEYSLRKYDVIAYRNNKNVNIIHRIIEIDTVDGVLRYTTRGDANGATDSYKPTFEDVIGRYTGKRIPVVGIFISFFQSYAGIVTVCSVVYCLWSIDRQNKKLEFAEEDRKEMLEQVFDLPSMNENTYQEMATDVESKIYYQGFCYQVNDKGFVSKNEMTEEEKKEFDVTNLTKVEKDGEQEKKTIFSSLLHKITKKETQQNKEGKENEKEDD